MVILVLLHRGKGGGLSSMFGGGMSSSLSGSSVGREEPRPVDHHFRSHLGRVYRAPRLLYK